MLDLSHELDYAQRLAGSLSVEHAVCKKVSDLEIDTDDLLLLSGKTSDGAYFHISLNYFTRKPMRQIFIDGKGISIHADLITNTLSVMNSGDASDFSWSELEGDKTYASQHRSILNDDRSFVCSFNEGLETMRLIDQIQSFAGS